jgi:hypothetical protein
MSLAIDSVPLVYFDCSDKFYRVRDRNACNVILNDVPIEGTACETYYLRTNGLSTDTFSQRSTVVVNLFIFNAARFSLYQMATDAIMRQRIDNGAATLEGCY